MTLHVALLSFLRTFLFIPILFFYMSAQALEPVLEIAATQSGLASKGLLLDITTAGHRHVAVGERGNIVFSDDDGNTWQQAQVPVSATLTAVYFSTPQYGWAVGHSGVILATRNGGESWVRQFDGHHANRLIVDQIKQHIVDLDERISRPGSENVSALKDQLDDAYFALENAEADLNSGAATPLLDVWFANAYKGIAIGAYGYMFCTNNAGKDWQNCANRISNQDRYHLNAIGQLNGEAGQSHPEALFIVGEAGRMFVSTDLGEHWLERQSPYEGSLFGVLGTDHKHGVLVFGLRGHVYRSDDLGDTWQRIHTDTTATLMQGITHPSKPMMLVGNAGVMLESNDGGKSFAVQQRTDRISMTSIAYSEKGHVLVTGMAGIKITSQRF